jgi:hypothetical protein
MKILKNRRNYLNISKKRDKTASQEQIHKNKKFKKMRRKNLMITRKYKIKISKLMRNREINKLNN